MLRGRAVVQRRRRPRLAVDPCGPCPVYTVMIAVYGEAEIVPQLVATLKRLDWPVSRLDIKFVCEADDRETIAALRAQTLGPQFEIVEVPPMHPRTKPKALTYALNGARGAYVAVYDAEDRPHPQQLREAYAKFRSAPADVACLQAPLVIGNGGENWISSMFALEYSALFRALLPMLARYRMPLRSGARLIISAPISSGHPAPGIHSTSRKMPISACGSIASVIAPMSSIVRPSRMHRPA